MRTDEGSLVANLGPGQRPGPDGGEASIVDERLNGRYGGLVVGAEEHHHPVGPGPAGAGALEAGGASSTATHGTASTTSWLSAAA